MEQILAYALENLRGVHLSQLVHRDFDPASATDAGACGSFKNQKSIPCGFGDIDLFVSHSWRDPPEAKFAQLQAIVSDFRRRHGREPLLWIDKFCIDQADIGNGIRYLPVHLLCSRKVVSLVGSTYLTRAWCCWELFMAMGQNHRKSSSIELGFHLLDRSELPLVLKQFEDFDMEQTNCHSSDELARMIEIIKNSKDGLPGFNATVSQYVHKLPDLQRSRGGATGNSGAFALALAMGGRSSRVQISDKTPRYMESERRSSSSSAEKALRRDSRGPPNAQSVLALALSRDPRVAPAR